MISLRRLFGMHDHKWVELERGRIAVQYGDGPLYPSGLYITYQCSHCLKLKEVRK